MTALWPYSSYNSGRVSDAEHELLWGNMPDGTIWHQPNEDALGLSVNLSTRAWTLQPGRLLICGHILDVTNVTSGTLAAGGTAARVDVITGFIDRTTSPWTYGIAVKQGTPGGGRPLLSTSITGRYEVGLAVVQVDPNGQALQTFDLRRRSFPAPETFGPGSPVALNVGTTQQTVNTLIVGTAPWKRYLLVSASCYVDLSQPDGDVFDLQLWYNGALLPNGGRARVGGVNIATVHLSGGAVYIAPTALANFSIRLSRFSGVGLAGTSADSHFNHIDVLAIPG